MTYRKKFTITLSTLLIPIFLIIVGMVIIDPYFCYHKPIAGIPYTLEEDAYINAGILKNFDYDSVIIGSSLAALMEPSIVDEKLGANTVKTTISGASTKNGAFLMEYALNNKEICNIIYSLDYNALLGDKSQLDRELPQYLYDKNPFNDLQYILNKDIWIDGVFTLFDKNRKTPLITNFDEAYGFDKYVQFSRASVISNMPEGFFSDNMDASFTEYSCADDYIDAISTIEPEFSVIDNISSNIVPIIENNTNVQFYIYMAPMPVLAWYSRIAEKGEAGINQVCANLYYVFNELSKYDNCHLGFFYSEDITYDMYRFCDLIHWDRNVGRSIINSLVDGKDIVKPDCTADKVYEFYEHIRKTDFSVYNGMKYECQNITDFDEYIETICSDKYINIVLVNGELPAHFITVLKDKGLVSELCNENSYYYSVVQNGIITHEKMDNSPFENSFELNDKNVQITTKGYASEASIKIEDGEYCPEEEPLDIVVIDRENGSVIDSVGLNIETGELIQY